MKTPQKKNDPVADDLYSLGTRDWEVMLDEWEEEGEDSRPASPWPSAPTN